MNALRFVVAGGGTGGHVTMALALGEAMREAGDEVLFIGGERGLEGRLVPAAGFELVRLPAAQVMGRGALGRLRALAPLARGAVAARRVLARFAPHVIVSVGGYAAVPALVAAWLRRTPVALVEPNAIPGRTHRAAAPIARRIYLGFDAARGSFARADAAGHVRVSGVPLRRALVDAFDTPDAPAPADGPLRLLVFGGSQGARQINDAVIAALPQLEPARLRIAHQTGEADRERVAAAYAAAGFDADVFAFDPDMPARYRWADLALCRSGAITVAELALAGLPALLVPYPYAADDHQTANAHALTEFGAARLLDTQTLDGKVLADALAPLVEDREPLRAMGRRARERARPEASREIVADCRTLASGPNSLED